MRAEHWLYIIPLRFRSLFRKRSVESELDEELREHVQQQSEHLIAQGLSPGEARYTALKELGGIETCKEACRDARSTRFLEDLATDVRFGLRMLRRSPFFACFAILILAIGVGGNTAVFTIINSVLIRPLPYKGGDHLVVATETIPREQILTDQVSYPLMMNWYKQAQTFASIGGFFTDDDNVLTGYDASHQQIAYASAGLFTALGTQPILGRVFSAEDASSSDAHAVVLSESFWREHFGGSHDVLGKAVTVGDAGYTVVGVMPHVFDYAMPKVNLWLPLETMSSMPFMHNRDVCFLTVIGRLRDGVKRESALAELSTIQKQAQQAFPGTDAGHGVWLQPLRNFTVGPRSSSLLLFGAAVFCLLLVACVNIAGLMLERSASRRREFAMRRALGAPRNRIVRQLLTETLVLAALGGVLGFIAASAALSLFSGVVSKVLPIGTVFSMDRDGWWFALAATLLTGLATGMAPAFSAGRPQPKSAAVVAGSGVSVADGAVVSHWLVGGEIAFTVVLLCAAGLLIGSFSRLMHVNPGFRTDHLLTATISLPSSHYSNRRLAVEFFNGMTDRLAHLPGIREASAVSTLPINGGDSQGFVTIENHPFNAGQSPSASFRRVLPNYFRMMSIPILRGREFQSSDQGAAGNGLMVVLINERMAKTLWPDRSPIGDRIKIGPPQTEPWLTIVGVVGDVHNTGLEAQPGFATYEPLAQRPRATMTFVARTEGDPRSAVESVTSTLRQGEPEGAIFDVMSMDERVASSVAAWKLNATLTGTFAALALLLAMTGIYASISFSVRQRTPEIGLRMALGAQPGAVMRNVMGAGLRMAIAGAAAGLAAAIGVARAMHSLLFEVSPADPTIYGLVISTVVLTVMLASFPPARRATRINPTQALRAE